jgi:hypothetical protein
MCPTSNTALRFYASTAEHPLDRLRHVGPAVSVNTDDLCLLGVTLPGESVSCLDVYGGARMTCAPWCKPRSRRASPTPRRKLIEPQAW